MEQTLARKTLNRIKRRDKAARWVITLGGVSIIASVIAILLLIIGVTLPLAVGDSQGGLTTWSVVRAESAARLTRIHDLASHPQAIREILPLARNKMLLSLGEGGTLHLDQMTTRRHLLSIREASPLVKVGTSPRAGAVVAMDAAGQLVAWRLDCPHPEVSWGVLFGKTWYEGYPEPGYTWQTTGGEDYEPKLSLVPLLFGTVKSASYAMLFAVPLALFGAVYVSHFTTPAFQGVIKPVVEIMAALPSVVLGFLAALWLAPLVERWIIAVFASFVTVPVAFILFMVFWQAVRRHDWAKRVERGCEFLVSVPVLLLGIVLACLLVAPLESLADPVARGPSLGQPRDLRCGHDRLRPCRGGNHDRAHGHRQYAHP